MNEILWFTVFAFIIPAILIISILKDGEKYNRDRENVYRRAAHEYGLLLSLTSRRPINPDPPSKYNIEFRKLTGSIHGKSVVIQDLGPRKWGQISRFFVNGKNVSNKSLGDGAEGYEYAADYERISKFLDSI